MAEQIIVFYHGGGCLDGFGAAWAVWKALGDAAEYVPIEYGSACPAASKVAGKDVYFLDISFEPEEMMALAKVARKFFVYDHHETSFKKWTGAGDAIMSATLYLENGEVVFDLERSTAMIAWNAFHQGEAPAMIRYIQEYDLGRTFRGTAMRDTEEYVARLSIEDKNFHNWSFLSDLHRIGANGNYRSTELEDFISEGGLMVQQKKALAEKICNGASIMPVVIDGVEGLMMNGGQELVNEIGHILSRKSNTFALIWNVENERVRISLRADGHCNVSRLASLLGGGGRQNTAGATVALHKFIPDILTPAMVLARSRKAMN